MSCKTLANSTLYIPFWGACRKRRHRQDIVDVSNVSVLLFFPICYPDRCPSYDHLPLISAARQESPMRTDIGTAPNPMTTSTTQTSETDQVIS
ncbi:hypothetical protein OE88DRAFT_1654577 [Heliocybe sulcata]|uniref:Uncharacterized protein n=1 Tax=Heliocybe sulcata TaxID=5364 RepID=A0A5C3NKE3_9AGAM|nr:hypothetical protein OE88DRAFT_1654577 [Heliocybe sulcata]